jgi:nicotinate-nucleotide adenylyltransferase
LKIGLFFGSFNPIHIGHLIIANSIAENSTVDKVWFVVSPHNPFKSPKSLLHEFDRLDMVRMAIDDNSNLSVSDIEFHLPRPSYTIDTLTYLTEKFPQHKFSLIIGEDNLNGFPKWKNHEQILKNYPLLVYPRPHSEPASLASSSGITFIQAPLLDISATFIRESVKQGRSIKYLVPESVENYIRFKKFYI